MATKPKVEKKADKKTPAKKVDATELRVANQVPAGAERADIQPVVVKEPELTFDERTSGVNQPWLNEDGSQNVG